MRDPELHTETILFLIKYEEVSFRQRLFKIKYCNWKLQALVCTWLVFCWSMTTIWTMFTGSAVISGNQQTGVCWASENENDCINQHQQWSRSIAAQHIPYCLYYPICFVLLYIIIRKEKIVNNIFLLFYLFSLTGKHQK